MAGMIFESDELPDPPNPPEEPVNIRKKGSLNGDQRNLRLKL